VVAGEVKKPKRSITGRSSPKKTGFFASVFLVPPRITNALAANTNVSTQGIVCDRCGVEVTQARVRRERMGHIDLVTPVSHIWFFKTMPSRIGNLLDLSVRALEKVLYYEEYIVLDPKQTPLKPRQLLTEDEYLKAQEQYGPENFVAQMGAEAVQTLLSELELDKLTAKYHRQLKAAKSKQSRARAVKVLKIVEAFYKSGNHPEWMIMKVVPVIPPDLRRWWLWTGTVRDQRFERSLSSRH